MAEKMDIELKKCVTHEFMVSFPSLFQAKAFREGDPKYSTVAIWDKKTKQSEPASKQKISLKQAIINAATEKWGDKDKWPKKLKMPFRDGEEFEDREGYGAGVMFATLSSKTRPGIVDKNRKPILDSEEIYPGCYGRAEVVAFAYDAMGNKGVGLALLNFQKTREGQRLSGRKAAEDVFESFDDGSDDEDNYGDDEDDTPPAKTKKKRPAEDDEDSLGF